jgi:hypothetical protein
MTRITGFLSALILGLLLLVPIAAAAEPWDGDEHTVVTTGVDMTLPADQHVDVFVVYDGHAVIEGDAKAIFVVQGTAELVGGRSESIVAIRSEVILDGTSVVTGDIRTMSSTVTNAPGSTIGGAVRELSGDLAVNWGALGSALFLVYLAFAVSVIAFGVVLAGLASRQVREAGALIVREPLQTVGAAFLGLIGLIVAGVVAIVTVVGIPFGIALLVLVMPALLLVGHLVAGITIGDWIVTRMTPGRVRERPYLAAVIGLAIVGIVSIVPVIGGLFAFVGFGAVILLMWRVARGGRRAASDRTGPEPSLAPVPG